MRAGRMDRRITIQRYETVHDGHGGFEYIWSDIATLWAKVQQESGREFLSAAAIQSERQIVFTTRWLEVDVTDRVIFEDKEFNIKEVRELGRQAGVELHAVG